MAKKRTAEKATTEKKTNDRANALEERRKRFGMPPAEEKEKELAQEAESSTELLTALGDSTHVGLGRGGES